MQIRKLASVQRIWKIEPIDGADRIELAHVLGWQCVVNKGQFQPMDLAIYFEIDSFLPVRPEFEFLRASSYKNNSFMGEGFRVKTMKFRGQISQGLVLPISEFAEIPADVGLGDDISKYIGVRKWEVEERVTTGGTIMGVLPYDVPHTDETRCFVPTTKIHTDQGLIRISDIVNKKLQCKVLTYNENTGQIEWDAIVNYYKRTAIEPVCMLTYPFKFNSNRTKRIIGSVDHRVMTQNGWTRMQDVEVGDSLFLPTECYDSDVIQFIAGMLLGDSGITTDGRKQKDGRLYSRRRVSFTQGEKQLEYLKEKLRILAANTTPRQSKSGYCDNNIYKAHLRNDDTIEEWLVSLFGNDKGITVTKEYADYLTPISLAFWYMDDGCLHQYKDKTWQSQITLCTHAYSKEENEVLVLRLLDFGVESKIYTIHKGDKEYYELHLPVEATKKFQSLIAKYVHPSMRYKLDDEYACSDYMLDEYVVGMTNKLVAVPVLNKDVKTPSRFATNNKLYNIETANNHNYFAGNVLVHNCQAEPGLIQEFAGLRYYISTKMDGSSHSLSIDNDGFHVTGHNYEYKNDGVSSFYRFVNERGLKDRMYAIREKYGMDTFTVQGEFCAPGIQQNRLRLKRPEWYVFTIRVNSKRIGLYDMQDLCQELGVLSVPIEEVGMDLPSVYPDVESLLARADGEYPNGGKKEGIVIRPTEPVFCELISASLSMKVVSNKYLLKNE